MRDEKNKIIDVAFDFVSDSHEGFTRAFSKHFGMTPKYYCKNTPVLKLFMPSRVRDHYLKIQKGKDIMSKNSNINPVFVQGVEVPADFAGQIPEGFELIDLPSCKMMVFQGKPFDEDKLEDSIEELWEVMKTYNPEIYGFKWADEDGPRFQLIPMGYRGYIEARPVRQLNQ